MMALAALLRCVSGSIHSKADTRPPFLSFGLGTKIARNSINIHIRSPNIESNSSVNWSSQHSQHRRS
jgi:hypothetical protein